MIMDVRFSESSKTLDASLNESNSTIPAKIREVARVGGVSDEHIVEVVEAYLNENSYLKESDLENAVNNALKLAKESGEFDGRDGEDGYTPVKGVDYFTPIDIDEIVNSVLENFADVSEVGM